MAREFDLVLFGATGVTGRLVAEHLTRCRPPIRWALAGRDHDRLAAVRTRLSTIDAAAGALPLIVVSALDHAAVSDVARRARVVCTTVGPFARYGGPLVAACADHGTHYCDVTGETPFVRASIDALHDRAVATGARIVHCCGFDSVPSDLGTFLLHHHLAANGDRLREARFRVVGLRGAVSAGTMATMIELFAESADPRVRAVLGDPYALDPPGSPRGPWVRDQLGPRLDEGTGHWTAPFVMAPINTRVVRRSNALSGHAYGRDFRYDEALDTGPGSLGFARALAVSAALSALYAASVVQPSRAVFERLLPALGDGMESARARGFFRIEIRATSVRGTSVRAVIAGNRDPGYEETAKMLGESALCLANDEATSGGGVLTPAAAFGHALVRRLRGAGLTLSVQVPRLNLEHQSG